ncbi:DUF4229 domain-containing protein [Mycobacterium sp. 050134]|uniref:DUF4229 domain-containing protein n=1 Tax=Mycobacterium sp. 050134 TaxID=3096111 RepID=UPI002ED88212
MSERPAEKSAENHTDNRAGSRVAVDVALYAGARLLLAAALAGLIYGTARLLGITQFPLAIAVLFALIIAMPLGIVVFSPLRRRATASLAVAGERRRREREELRARLHGQAPDDEPDEGGERPGA